MWQLIQQTHLFLQSRCTFEKLTISGHDSLFANYTLFSPQEFRFGNSHSSSDVIFMKLDFGSNLEVF